MGERSTLPEIVRRALGLFLAAAGAFMAFAEDCSSFKGGLWRTLTYDEPTTLPVIFSGESRAEDAYASDYCIWLDLWYDDGTPVWAVRADWSQGSHGWEQTAGAFVPARPVRKIEMHAFLRNGKGKAEFRNLKLERREGKGDVLLGSAREVTQRPYAPHDAVLANVITGRTIERKTSALHESSIPFAIPSPRTKSLCGPPIRCAALRRLRSRMRLGMSLPLLLFRLRGANARAFRCRFPPARRSNGLTATLFCLCCETRRARR